MQPPLALLLGWGGSKDKNLRPYARIHESQGADVIVHIPAVLEQLRRPQLILDGAARVHDEVSQHLERSERSLVVHSFSDNGFLAFGAMLERAARSKSLWTTRLAVAVLDSAPGLYQLDGPVAVGDAFARALGPLLARRHFPRRTALPRAVSLALRAAFSSYFALRPSVTAPMRGSARRFLDNYPGARAFLLYGSADEVVPPKSVEAFASDLSHRGVNVTRERFDGSAHVAHLLTDRRRYEAIVRTAYQALRSTAGASF